nr:MAG TPA: hypothetical protein [Caudoviricetes sp.]
MPNGMPNSLFNKPKGTRITHQKTLFKLYIIAI